jgi:hypothetical protein
MRRIGLLVSCALFALIACKDTTSPGSAGPPQPGGATAGATPGPAPVEQPPPPAGESANTPAGTPELPAGVVVKPRETPDSKSPEDRPPAGASVECTPDKRKGGMCTREFRPVCGSYADKTTKTFSNPCVACSDEKVASYVAGECAAAK